MQVTTQEDVDRAFADLDVLLSADRPTRSDRPGCISCHGNRFYFNSRSSSCPGEMVCDDCGVCQNNLVFFETMYGNSMPRKSSNYKRIHHWHERVSQLLLLESEIIPEHMLQIGQRLCSGEFTVINKDTIRSVLRSLNMQPYIEKWLQICFRVTNIAPPVPGMQLCQQLDALFTDLQKPFDWCKGDKRKNFLNYNYVFSRLFQKLKCPQFCMFFPLIKSKHKLRTLDETWGKMLDKLNWPIVQMESIQPFSVQLNQPESLLARLASRCAVSALAVIPRDPFQREIRMLGRCHRFAKPTPLRKRPRSSSPEPEAPLLSGQYRPIPKWWVKELR